MKTLNLLTLSLAFTATSAFANDHLAKIRDHARDLEREFRGIERLAKDKKAPVADLQSKVNLTDERIEQLKAAASEFESSNPQMAAHPEWKNAKDIITLLDIFHTQKAQLISDGSVKNRSLLKSHANGLAKRSSALLMTADRLARGAGA